MEWMLREEERAVRPVRTLFTQRAKELMSSPQGKSNIRPCPLSVPTHVICMWHWPDSSEHYSGLHISVKEHWCQILEGTVFFFFKTFNMFHNTTMYMLSIFCLDMSIFSGILCDIQFTAVTEIIFSTTRQYLLNSIFLL